MKQRLIALSAIMLMMLMMVAGCTKRYVITHDLESPLPMRPVCHMGEIRDELPADIDPAKKPSLEDIQKFKNYLVEEVMKKELFGTLDLYDATHAQYRITGAILDYKKGSGFLRFLFGAWAGGSKVTTVLELKDITTGDVVFGGNFTGVVTGGFETGDTMFKVVAKDFAKALEKKNKKLNKGE